MTSFSIPLSNCCLRTITPCLGSSLLKSIDWSGCISQSDSRTRLSRPRTSMSIRFTSYVSLSPFRLTTLLFTLLGGILRWRCRSTSICHPYGLANVAFQGRLGGDLGKVMAGSLVVLPHQNYLLE